MNKSLLILFFFSSKKKLQIIIKEKNKKERFLLNTNNNPPVLETSINKIKLFNIFLFINQIISSNWLNLFSVGLVI